jgi:hypothetical protein
MPQVGFEPAVPACERPQVHALDRAAIGLGYEVCHGILFMVSGRAIFIIISSKKAQFSETIL